MLLLALLQTHPLSNWTCFLARLKSSLRLPLFLLLEKNSAQTATDWRHVRSQIINNIVLELEANFVARLLITPLASSDQPLPNRAIISFIRPPRARFGRDCIKLAATERLLIRFLNF